MLKLFYSTSSAGGFFSPLAHKKTALFLRRAAGIHWKMHQPLGAKPTFFCTLRSVRRARPPAIRAFSSMTPCR